MSEKTCGSCAWFLQHYAFNKRKIFRVCCGHCTHLTAKKKKPDRAAYVHYTEAAHEESPFVSKEYLSKELLAYVLSLELLPEIHDPEAD